MSTLPAPVLKKPCAVCGGDANARNNWRHECVVVECPWRHLARQYERVRGTPWGVQPPPDPLFDDPEGEP